MRRPFGQAVALALAGHLLPADAAAEMPMLPQDLVCVSEELEGEERRVLDPRRLVLWAVGSAGISDAALDADGDGDTLLVEKQLALTQPEYCTAAPTRGCSEADARALASLQESLRAFVAAEGGALYRFERIRRPDALDVADSAALDPALETQGQPFHLGEVLDPTARFVRIHCLAGEAAPAPGAEAAPAPEAEPPIAQEPPPSPERGLLGGFRLTRDIDDLSKDRTRLREVKAAEFSITGNLRDDRTSYHVSAVAGWHFTLERDQRAQLSTIPFVQLERFFDGARTAVDKLGFGLQTAAHLRGPTVGIQELAITPVYLTDTNLDSAIGTLKMRWTPALAEDAPVPLGFYRHYGPVLARLGFDALLDSGRVFDPGDKEALEESAFLRVGGQLGLRLSGAPDTPLAQFEIELAHKYLYNLNGDVEHVNRFEAGISYLFPGLENYKLSFRYTVGRTDDTLDRIEFWKTQLGIRF